MGLENPTHLLFLAIIVLLIFGPKRLPELGRSMGSGIRHVKDSISGDDRAEDAPQTEMAPTPTTHDSAAARATSTEAPQQTRPADRD
jgi:sec-independent protein translocase protein TatA